MEKEGPMHGFPKEAGLIVSGTNPVYVDYVASYLMGFNPRKIRYIKESFSRKWGRFNLKEDSINVKSNSNWKKVNKKFIPSKGWKGFCER